MGKKKFISLHVRRKGITISRSRNNTVIAAIYKSPLRRARDNVQQAKNTNTDICSLSIIFHVVHFSRTSPRSPPRFLPPRSANTSCQFIPPRAQMMMTALNPMKPPTSSRFLLPIYPSARHAIYPTNQALLNLISSLPPAS